MAELQLAFQSYEARANQFSQQRLVNLFWEQGVEGTKSEGILYKRPGLKSFATVGTGPIRGVWTMKGVPFIVSGTDVFTLDNAGVATNLGTMTGSGLVDMNDNGEQVAIVSGQNGYIAVPFVETTTELSVAAAASDVIITVADRGNMAVDDIIKITLDSTAVDSTTIAALEGDTTLSGAMVATDTVVPVVSEAGITVGDTISIVKNDDAIFTDTVASLAPLTMNNGIDGAASIGNTVTFSNDGTVKLTDAITDVAAIGNDVVYQTPTLTLITDPNFRAVSSVTFQDGFFIWTEANTGRAFSSPLLNGLGPYDALNFATAEYESDNLVKAFSDHDDLFLCGTDTVEPWVAGGTAFPYVPNSGTVMEVGLLARNAITKVDNGVILFGNAGERGGRSVWRIRGYSAQRISTHALESIWEGVDDVSDSYATSFRLEGHEFFVLTIPDTGTYVYDASTQRWCEWQTFNNKTWAAIGYSRAFNKNLVAAANGNGVFELSFDFLDDDGQTLKWEATTVPIATPNNYRATHKYLRIDMQSGVGLTIGQGSNPQIWLSWANEDEKFGNLHLLDVGKKGETKTRVQKRRLGQARSRTYKITGTDPVFTAIMGVYLELIGGVS